MVREYPGTPLWEFTSSSCPGQAPRGGPSAHRPCASADRYARVRQRRVPHGDAPPGAGPGVEAGERLRGLDLGGTSPQLVALRPEASHRLATHAHQVFCSPVTPGHRGFAARSARRPVGGVAPEPPEYFRKDEDTGKTGGAEMLRPGPGAHGQDRADLRARHVLPSTSGAPARSTTSAASSPACAGNP